MSDPIPLKTKPDPDTDARLVLAACAVGDTVYTGWRHGVIMVEQLKPLGLAMQSTSGFVDQHGFFWDREMSARIASAAKQTSVFHGSLMSENLWDMDGTPRSPSGPYNPLGDVKPSPPAKLADEGELRRLWIEAGGSFHGPNVEHGSMPEAKLLPFLGALVRDRDDAFVEAKAQQDRRFEALRERDTAKASAQTACEQLTQQMAETDRLRKATATTPAAPSDEAARLRAVLEWFAGDDTGISSEAIARVAVGLPPSTSFGPLPPSDVWDRGRCVRLLRRFPWMLPALATLESAGGEWRTQGKLIREGFLTAVTASKEK